MHSFFGRRLRLSWIFAFVSFLSLGVTGLVPQPAKSYGVISDLTTTVADSTKSAVTTYSTTFTIQNAVPIWGRININVQGPSGYTSGSSATNVPNFNSATVAAGSTSSIYFSSSNWNGATFYTNAAISAGTTITLNIAGVINPSQGGYYFAHVWTSNYYSDIDGTSNWGGDYNSSYFEIGSNTNLKGKITDSDNVTPVPFASVSLYNYNGSSWSSYYTYADKNGDYGFGDIPAGSYTFYFNGPYSYGTGKTYFSPANATVTIPEVEVTTRDVSFLVATKTLSGNIAKTVVGGTAVTNATVWASRSSGNGYASATPDSNGNYSFDLVGGDWYVGLYATTWPTDWVMANVSETVSFADDSTTESKTKNFVVDVVNSTVTGTISKGGGSLVSYSTSLSFTNSKNQYFYASVNADGSFSTQVAAGTYKVSGWTSESGFAFPAVSSFSISDNETKNLGTITLTAKTDVIRGTVLDNLGAPVSGVSVSSWKDEPYDWAYVTTGSDGTYQLQVTPGNWRVSAWPQWNSGYLYTGDSQTVAVASGVTSTLNFEFKICNSTVNGSILDPDGNIIDSLYSWVNASDGSQDWGNTGTSVEKGIFSLKLPAGTWDLNAYLYNSDFGSPDPVTVTVADGETKSATLTAPRNDATISGTIYDDQGAIVTGKWMNVYATKGKYGSWMNASVNQSDGTYTMNVSAGTWRLGWWIDKSSGFNSGDGQDVSVEIAAGATATKDIILRRVDSSITGKATKSDGTAMTWAWITADTRDPNEKSTGSQTYYYSNGASSNSDGNYTLALPAGTYWVGGSMWRGSGYINPKRQKVVIDSTHPANVDLVFRSTNATITGSTSTSDGATSSYVSAWSEDGGYAEANAANDGQYTLNLSNGTIWHIRAVKELNKEIYRSAEYLVDMSLATTATQNISLVKQSFILPDTLMMTFDPTKQQTIKVSDGTSIVVPANTIATSGQITITITPTITLPSQSDAKPGKYGYDIVFTDENGEKITTFSGNITIEYAYTSDDLTSSSAQNENELNQAYFDEASGAWKRLTNCAISESENKIVCQVNHATKFSLVAASDTTPPQAPTSVSALAGDGKVTLSWTNPTDSDLSGLKIYRSTTSGVLGDLTTTVTSTTTSYANTGLANGTVYYYTIRPYDTLGNTSISTTQVSATPAVSIVAAKKSAKKTAKKTTESAIADDLSKYINTVSADDNSGASKKTSTSSVIMLIVLGLVAILGFNPKLRRVLIKNLKSYSRFFPRKK